MVSNARDDFPEPERPVRTTMRSRGSSRETLRRLCSRAPRITSLSATAVRDYPGRPGRPRVGTSVDGVRAHAATEAPRCSRSTHGAQLTLQLLHLVAQAGGVLETQVG